MHVFITGASGVIPELLAAGHSVSGLARSDAAAALVERRGAAVVRGDLSDHDLLARSADGADGVVHLAFPHDDMNALNAAADLERGAVAAMTGVLEVRPFVAASGTPAVSGRPSTEADVLPAEGPMAGRARNERELLATAGRGVRASVVRLPRSVHGEGDAHGFVATLAGMFREAGTAMYVGEGTNRWCAVHIGDAARLLRVALEAASPGSVLHAVGDEGIAVRALAEALAVRLDLPVTPVGPEALGFFGVMQTVDHATTAEQTRARFAWEPTGPTLLDDIAAGHYDR